MSSGGSETTSWRYGLRPTGRPGTLLHRKEQLRCGLFALGFTRAATMMSPRDEV